MTGLLHPAEIRAMPADEALRVLRDEAPWEVDRRLRAIGLYPVRPDQCGHGLGLTHVHIAALFRCQRCGLTITDETVAMLQGAPSPSEELAYVGGIMARALERALLRTPPSDEARAAVRAWIEAHQ